MTRPSRAGRRRPLLQAWRRFPALALTLAPCLGLTLTLSTLACQVHLPSIGSVNVRLYLRPSADGAPGGAPDGAPSGAPPREYLSLFAQARDEDGSADLAYLYVINDAAELCWTLSPENWSMTSDSGATWIGSNGLSAPDGEALPRGAWRLVLVDLAGQRSELDFSLSAPDSSGYKAPAIQLSGDNLSVGTGYDLYTVFFLDAADNVVKTAELTGRSASLDSLWGSGAWRQGADYLAVYGLDIKSEVGFFSWTIRLPD